MWRISRTDQKDCVSKCVQLGTERTVQWEVYSERTEQETIRHIRYRRWLAIVEDGKHIQKKVNENKEKENETH